MLEREQLDAVYVCLPPFAHGDPEYAVLERNLHLFVEKPQALNVEIARDIAARVEESGVISCVGYNWRYLDVTEKARELLSGVRPALAFGYWIGGTPGSPWWRVKSKSGGQIVEQTTHVYDCARYLMGDVVSVYAAGTRGLMQDLPNYDVEDASTVSLTFESGAVATILSSCVAEQGYGTGLQVIARGITVKIEGRTLEVERENETVKYPGRNNPYQLENELFLQAIEEGNPSLVRSAYGDVVDSLAVTLAANESIESGQVVHFG
jgi:predicted dehydrogenase